MAAMCHRFVRELMGTDVEASFVPKAKSPCELQRLVIALCRIWARASLLLIGAFSCLATRSTSNKLLTAHTA